MENGKEGQRFNSVEEVTQLSTLGHVFHTEARSTLDYCVFPLKAPQYHTVNRILFSNDNTGSCQTLVSRSIAAYPRQCEVWLATAKSGTLRGFLSKNPYYIKMAGSNKYQKMWPVQLEKNIGRCSRRLDRTTLMNFPSTWRLRCMGCGRRKWQTVRSRCR